MVTSTVPYGLTSPFAGTVEPIVVRVLNLPMKDALARATGATANSAVAAAPATAVDARAILPVIPTGLSPFHGWLGPLKHGGGRPANRMKSRALSGPPTRTMLTDCSRTPRGSGSTLCGQSQARIPRGGAGRAEPG